MDRYILNEAREAVPCTDLMEWGRMFEDPDTRRVGRTRVGEHDISTVFLALDHSFGEGPPMLFETMVFGPDKEDEDMERCSTWAEAEAMHARFVEKYRAHNAHPSGTESGTRSPVTQDDV